MELIVISIILIGGIATGIYWYRAVDAPRQKSVKSEGAESVIIDGAERGRTPDDVQNTDSMTED